ncbi:MAG: hypothetical protein QNJ72_00455 [Pleurocapsa sp. MO_226.B13]|nr:hypothetical protein [Pleurocapsa sp. MO_226.B13]
MSNTDTKWEQALLNKVTSNGERIAVIERDIKDLKTSTSKMAEDIAGLKTDVAGLKTDVAGLKTDVAGLKTDVAGLKTDVSSLDSRLSNVEKLIDDVKKILKWIVGGIGAIIFSLIANFIYENFI